MSDKLWAGSICAMFADKVDHSACIVEAQSYNEAVGKLTELCKQEYPNGLAYSVSALDISEYIVQK